MVAPGKLLPIRLGLSQQLGGLVNYGLKGEILILMNLVDFCLLFGLLKVVLLEAVEDGILEMCFVFKGIEELFAGFADLRFVAKHLCFLFQALHSLMVQSA